MTHRRAAEINAEKERIQDHTAPFKLSANLRASAVNILRLIKKTAAIKKIPGIKKKSDYPHLEVVA